MTEIRVGRCERERERSVSRTVTEEKGNVGRSKRRIRESSRWLIVKSRAGYEATQEKGKSW